MEIRRVRSIIILLAAMWLGQSGVLAFMPKKSASGEWLVPPPAGTGQSQSSIKKYPGYLFDSVNVEVFIFHFQDEKFDLDKSELLSAHYGATQEYTFNSNGKMTLTFSIHPEEFTFPGNAADYADDWYSYRDFYLEKISEAGTDPDDPGPHTRIIVAHPEFGNYNSSGGPPLCNIRRDHYDTETVIHELGHTFGLRHANGLEAGERIVGDEDWETENLNYGNVYDFMGMAGLDHFNMLYKHYFGWYDAGERTRIRQSGTYRIYAHDQTTRSGNSILATIPSGDGRFSYWLEYRISGRYTTGEGIQIHLAGYLAGHPDDPRVNDPTYWDTTSLLLDMTPESQTTDGWWADDMTDAELLVGKTFEDPYGGFSITVLEANSSSGSESWIDFEIELLKPLSGVKGDPAPGSSAELGFNHPEANSNRYNLRGQLLPVKDSPANNLGIYISKQSDGESRLKIAF